MEKDILTLATDVLEAAKAKGVMIATAESCTGGLIIGALTEIAGSSAAIERGFITYTNEAKQDMLGVTSDTLKTHGAVSEPTAREMADGAVKNSRAALSVSVTGIAGPGGATPGKPVGLVHFATAHQDKETQADHFVFEGDRQAVRRQAVKQAFRLLLSRLSD